MGATLSSTLQNNNNFGAAKCIDGNTEGPDEGVSDGASADFCHTEEEPTPWLAIDYGTTVTVQRVEIFNRRQCCGNRTRNVDVRISDELPTSGSQMFSGGTLLGSFAGPATDGQQITISGRKLHELLIPDKYLRPSNIWKIHHSPDEQWRLPQPQRSESFWRFR